VRAGAAPGFFAEGSKRYSMRVKRPSGGMEESALDCAKQFSLCRRSGWSGWLRTEYEPDTGMEGRVGNGV
jgi:hypothetical protein